jgi:pheromone shutdown protein TraB
MRTIYLVGTFHGGLTPHNQLADMLFAINPSQIFVELTMDEVRDIGSKELFRDEMVYVYNWAQEHSTPVFRYDVENDILMQGVTGSEPEFQKLSLQQKDIIEQYSWVELNYPENWNISDEFMKIEEEIQNKFINKDKCLEREQAMVREIHNQIDNTGTIVVLCGTGHLRFFKENLPDSVLYFKR